VAKKKKKAIKKSKKKEPDHIFVVVDLNEDDLVGRCSSRSLAESVIAAQMEEHEIDEREAEDRFVVWEVCREFSVQPERQYEIYLNEKETIDVD
jgi:hypothetical protein